MRPFLIALLCVSVVTISRKKDETGNGNGNICPHCVFEEFFRIKNKSLAFFGE